jgi:hypothetical protein
MSLKMVLRCLEMCQTMTEMSVLINSEHNVRCEVFTSMLLRIQIWDVTPSVLLPVGVSWCLRGLHDAQDKGNAVCENVVTIYQSTQRNTPEDLSLQLTIHFAELGSCHRLLKYE